MYGKLLSRYKQYAVTTEAKAIWFVKKHLKRADNRVWVDILKCSGLDHICPVGQSDEKDNESGEPVFRYVKCELFPRKTKPKYPPRNKFSNEMDYITVCRALTWEASHHDIDMLSESGYHGPVYEILGYIHVTEPSGLFRKDTPPEIKALALNLNDRTDPLWDEAVKYFTYATKKFKITNIRRVR